MSEEEKKESEETKDEEKNADIPEDKLSVTHHSVTINGEEIRYTATTGTLILKEEVDKEGEKPKAAVFFIAYTRDDVEDPSTRPITFSFNGGSLDPHPYGCISESSDRDASSPMKMANCHNRPIS